MHLQNGYTCFNNYCCSVLILLLYLIPFFNWCSLLDELLCIVHIFSLNTLNACCSWAWNSMITPTYNVWNTSLGSAAKSKPTFLRVLTVALLASTSIVKAPSSSVMARGSKERTMYDVSEVLGPKIVDTVLPYPTPACSWVVSICSLYKPVWMETRSCYCCCWSYCSSSVFSSLTLSLMSKSYFDKVIGSRNDLLALDFFHNPSFSFPQVHFIHNRVLS